LDAPQETLYQDLMMKIAMAGTIDA
jgi:hypothetical protein